MSLGGTALSRELEVAGRLARSAGGLVMGYRGGDLDIEMKNGDEPVTVADRGASDMIVGGLEAAFPDDIVICEETVDDPKRADVDRVWFVDPIDGTRDFIRGYDAFCVMIGLAISARPVLGVIYHPPSAELVVAASDSGAWLLPTGADPIRLSVSDADDLATSRIVTTTNKLQRPANVLTITNSEHIGSIGLKLAVIASGDADLFCNPASRSSMWDTCAPEAILTEAGGKITDLRGGELDYDASEIRHRQGLVASNGLIHAAACARAAPLLGDA